MGKIREVNGYVRMTLDKLEAIRGDLVQNDYLAKMNIKWQFSLSRAPWRGGQFECMVRIVKQAFNKSVGNGTLTWAELQDMLLGVEVALNNRPLSYVEEDVQLPLLTPNMFQFGCPNLLPDPEAHHQENPDLTSGEMQGCDLEKVVYRVPKGTT